MKNTLAKGLNNGLLRSIFTGAILFYALSGLTSLLNYAFYPAMSRFVSTEVYGEIQFLMSIFMQLSVGFVVINIVSIVMTAKNNSHDEQKKALNALNVVATTAVLIVIGVGFIVLGLSRELFGFTSLAPMLALCLGLVINIPFTITLGRLQGQQKFVFSGVIGLAGAILKLSFSVLFVAIGLGSAGAIGGIAAGLLAAIILAKALEGKVKAPKLSSKQKHSLRSLLSIYSSHLTHLKSERGLLIVALVAVGALTILSTVDVLISKMLLDPTEAGQYAAVATVSKTILYATSPLMWLALPLAMLNTPLAARKVRGYIRITALISLALLCCFALAPSQILNIFLGINAEQYTNLLPLASIAMTVFALAFIIITVELCRAKLMPITIASAIGAAGFIGGFLLTKSEGVMPAAITGQITAGLSVIIVSVLGSKIYGERRKKTHAS